MALVSDDQGKDISSFNMVELVKDATHLDIFLIKNPFVFFFRALPPTVPWQRARASKSSYCSSG